MSPSPNGSDLRFASLSLPIAETSQIGEARRRAAALAEQLGFSETEIGKAALAVTEAASNLVKHAKQGVLLLQPLCSGSAEGLEILALDSGPGMKDVERCLRDGFSTAGTPGTGLGALARIAGTFEIYSSPPTGTALLARLWLPSPSLAEKSGAVPRLEAGAVSVPIKGETVCGDAWGMEPTAEGGLVLVADGLGHGAEAADAAREAVRVFRANKKLDVVGLVQAIHNALRSTRGAAVAVAAIDLNSRMVRFAGLGNIGGTILAGGEARCMVSHNGTAGHNAHRIQEFAYPFPPNALLVMHSDGLLSRWSLGPYPGLMARHPGLAAGVLYRDFNRGRDDITAVVVRGASQEGAP